MVNAGFGSWRGFHIFPLAYEGYWILINSVQNGLLLTISCLTVMTY